MPVMSVRLAILALLSEGPKSGQQLCEELEARTGQVWPVNVDQVYAMLRRLECDGLVEPNRETPREGIGVTV
jgi:DNA-binding PadR family transcriptional regulator